MMHFESWQTDCQGPLPLERPYFLLTRAARAAFVRGIDCPRISCISFRRLATPRAWLGGPTLIVRLIVRAVAVSAVSTLTETGPALGFLAGLRVHHVNLIVRPDNPWATCSRRRREAVPGACAALDAASDGRAF
jgi:hypothetical protein